MTDQKQEHPAEIPSDPKEAAKLLVKLRTAKKFSGLLGIAQKAGKVVAGTELLCDAIRSGSRTRCPRAVFLASDASQNTKKRVTNCCTYYEIPLHEITLTTAELGSAIGKSGTISAAGIADKGLSDALVNLL